MTKRVAVYPISANPPTWGHGDILYRASFHFDHIYWVAAINPRKQYYFSSEERERMMQEYVQHYQLKNITVDAFEGSTARYAERVGAQVILKGMRNILDYQGELEQFEGNRGISEGRLETFCMFANPKYSRISSSLVRELAFLGESIDEYVHAPVASLVDSILKERVTFSSEHID